MSSHHIVREKQEPALLILSLQGFNYEWLGQLLEWSPTVVTTGAMAETLAIYDIKIDVVVGQAEGLPQSDIRYINVNEDVAGAALRYLADQGYPSVNIITDALDLDVYRPFVKQMDVVIYCGSKKVMAVKPGYSKWAPEGRSVEILEQPVNFLYTGIDSLSTNSFKTSKEGIYSFNFTGEYLFIAEQL